MSERQYWRDEPRSYWHQSHWEESYSYPHYYYSQGYRGHSNYQPTAHGERPQEDYPPNPHYAHPPPPRPSFTSGKNSAGLRDKRPRDSPTPNSPPPPAAPSVRTSTMRWDQSRGATESTERGQGARDRNEGRSDSRHQLSFSSGGLRHHSGGWDASSQPQRHSRWEPVPASRHPPPPPPSATAAAQEGSVPQPLLPLPSMSAQAEEHSRHKAPVRPVVRVNGSLRSAQPHRAPAIISVVSYNVLSQDLISKNLYLYRHCPAEFLDWEYRRILLLRDLTASASNIYCLQEVEEEHYHSWFKPELSKQGFEGVYQRRTGANVDGCAVFYCAKTFRLLEWKGVCYQRSLKVLDRDNVGIVAKLAVRKHPKWSRAAVFCVANTHLLFNPKAGEVKLAQLSLLFAELHKMASVPGSAELIPCLLCGDFNSTPSAPLVHLVEEARLDCSNLSAADVAGYYTDSNKHRQRRIPVPLLPASLSISQECVYVCACTIRAAEEEEKARKLLCGSQSTEPVSVAEQRGGGDGSALVTSNHHLSTSKDVIDLTESPTAMKRFSRLDVTATRNVASRSGGGKTFGGISLSDFPSLVEGAPTKTTTTVKKVVSTVTQVTQESTTAQVTTAASEEVNADCTITQVKKHCSCECFACKVWPCLRIEPTPLPPSHQANPSVLTHPFHFSSAYPHLRQSRSSTVTTFHGSAFETVDYIYYTSLPPPSSTASKHPPPPPPPPRFHLLSRMALPSTHSLLQLGPQPHKRLSSDHLLLMAVLQLL